MKRFGERSKRSAYINPVDWAVNPNDRLGYHLRNLWMPWTLSKLLDVTGGLDAAYQDAHAATKPGLFSHEMVCDGNAAARYASSGLDSPVIPKGAVEFWFKFDSFPGSLLSLFINFSSPAFYGVNVLVDKSGASPFIRGLVRAGGFSTGMDVTGTTIVTLHKWHHVVFVWRSGGVCELWMDGIKEGSATDADNFDFSFARNVQFGFSDSPVSTYTPIDGTIGMVRQFSTDLTAADIGRLYTRPASGLVRRRRRILWAGQGVAAKIASWGDTFGASDAERSDPNVFDSLAFTDAQSYKIDASYSDSSDTILFSGVFSASTGELANGRYRR